MRLLVLGGGAQGRVAARLALEHGAFEEVVVADVARPPGLPRRARFVRADATDARSVARAARGVDVALSAVPSRVGVAAVANLVAARVPTVDVAFSPEPPFHLDARARRARVPVVVDFGVAPGLSHVLAARARRELGGLDELRIYVGGLPIDPPPAFRHAVYFHALDLLDEYVRPARLRRAGRPEAPAPLSADVEGLADDEAGRLEAFPTDGLRSLLESYPDVPDMVERTLRVPGHLEAMRLLEGLGLLGDDASRGALARALETRFAGVEHPDRLLMEVWGTREGRSRTFRLHVVRRGDVTAMAQTTAGTAFAAAVLLGQGAFTTPGVHAPERMGDSADATRALLRALSRLDVVVDTASRLRPYEPSVAAATTRRPRRRS